MGDAPRKPAGGKISVSHTPKTITLHRGEMDCKIIKKILQKWREIGNHKVCNFINNNRDMNNKQYMQLRPAYYAKTLQWDVLSPPKRPCGENGGSNRKTYHGNMLSDSFMSHNGIETPYRLNPTVRWLTKTGVVNTGKGHKYSPQDSCDEHQHPGNVCQQQGHCDPDVPLGAIWRLDSFEKLYKIGRFGAHDGTSKQGT